MLFLQSPSISPCTMTLSRNCVICRPYSLRAPYFPLLPIIRAPFCLFLLFLLYHLHFLENLFFYSGWNSRFRWVVLPFRKIPHSGKSSIGCSSHLVLTLTGFRQILFLTLFSLDYSYLEATFMLCNGQPDGNFSPFAPPDFLAGYPSPCSLHSLGSGKLRDSRLRHSLWAPSFPQQSAPAYSKVYDDFC